MFRQKSKMVIIVKEIRVRKERKGGAREGDSTKKRTQQELERLYIKYLFRQEHILVQPV